MIFKIILDTVLGGLLGFGWYRMAGCSTGTCPLTSNPFISTIYGAIAGLLIALN